MNAADMAIEPKAGRAPIRRSSVLTLFAHRFAEVGLPTENPHLTEDGTVMWGFVERVGDPIPLVAPDNSSYTAHDLAAEALDSATANQS